MASLWLAWLQYVLKSLGKTVQCPVPSNLYLYYEMGTPNYPVLGMKKIDILWTRLFSQLGRSSAPHISTNPFPPLKTWKVLPARSMPTSAASAIAVNRLGWTLTCKNAECKSKPAMLLGKILLITETNTEEVVDACSAFECSPCSATVLLQVRAVLVCHQFVQHVGFRTGWPAQPCIDLVSGTGQKSEGRSKNFWSQGLYNT